MSLEDLHTLGQSVWLDYIRRHLLRSGQLAALIRDDGLRGVTSNPSIFEKAIAGSTDYGDAIARMADRSAGEIYEQLAIEDIRAAADLLRPVYDQAQRADGMLKLVLAEEPLNQSPTLWRLASQLAAQRGLRSLPPEVSDYIDRLKRERGL